jgi:hypothetical protein
MTRNLSKWDFCLEGTGGPDSTPRSDVRGVVAGLGMMLLTASNVVPLELPKCVLLAMHTVFLMGVHVLVTGYVFGLQLRPRTDFLASEIVEL